jgi:hypothetical protein
MIHAPFVEEIVNIALMQNVIFIDVLTYHAIKFIKKKRRGMLQMKMKNHEIKFWCWVVSKLPRKVIYFAFMHVMVYATTGKYSATAVTKLTGMEAIRRYRINKLKF